MAMLNTNPLYALISNIGNISDLQKKKKKNFKDDSSDYIARGTGISSVEISNSQYLK